MASPAPFQYSHEVKGYSSKKRRRRSQSQPEITSREILLIDENGVKMGIIPTAEGIRMAEERQLDLVEVAPQAAPPVCRILDYGSTGPAPEKGEDARRSRKCRP